MGALVSRIRCAGVGNVMAELKTKANDGDVGAFLASVEDEQRQADARDLCTLMEEVSGEPPVMWGPSIVGFGNERLVYASGREVDWMSIGFSPRKTALTLYLTCDIAQFSTQLENLGTYRTGKGCLYLKRLSDVDRDVLTELVAAALANSGK